MSDKANSTAVVLKIWRVESILSRMLYMVDDQASGPELSVNGQTRMLVFFTMSESRKIRRRVFTRPFITQNENTSKRAKELRLPIHL